MAENDGRGGISWFVRLLLDRKSAEKTKEDAKAALAGGTDPATPKKNLREVEGAFDRVKGVVVKLAAVLGSLWVVQQVKAYAQAVFDLGARVNATESQFRTVFGAISDGLEESLKDWRAIAGVTDTEFRKLLAAAGSMGQGMGMSAQASADFATEVVKLAGDLASFSGGAYTTEAAAQLLQSALIGNTEAARSLLINFTALDVQNRALEQTGKKSADALTQQEKALAGLSVITERAGPQLGDLVRTQKDADNQAKILAATWRQIKEDLAFSLLPVFDALFVTLDDTGAIDKLTAAAQALADNMTDLIALAVSFTKALLTAGTVYAVGRLLVAVKAADLGVRALTVAFRAQMAAIGPFGWFVLAVGGLTTLFQKAGQAARDAAKEAKDAADEFATSVGKMEAPAVRSQLHQSRADELDARRRVQQLQKEYDDAAKAARSGRGGRIEADDAKAALEAEKQALATIRERLKLLETRRDELAEASRNRPRDRPEAPPGEEQTDAERNAAAKRIRDMWDYHWEWAAARGAIGLARDSVLTTELRAEQERRRKAAEDFEAAGGTLEKFDTPDKLSTDVWAREVDGIEAVFASLWENVESASQHAAYEMASAFEDAFNLMREDGATIGNLFEGLGRGIAGSMLQGLAEYARGKVAENIASAIEAGAKALSAAAIGNAPSAAAFWSSAAQHSAAAVAWAAAAGGAGAARSGVTGGRGAVPAATRDAGLSAAERADLQPVPIEIWLQPFDPTNPTIARQTGRALDLNVHLDGRPEWAKAGSL